MAVLGLLAMSQTAAVAQDRPAAVAEPDGEIAGRLRAFYFNLAHGDWDALTADILPAKVVAHRPIPEIRAPDRGGLKPLGLASRDRACSADHTLSIRQAVIRVEGDWAQATVPHCPPDGGSDEFRLIRFAGRWRFVGIHLLRQPVSVTAER